jgi:glycosyltransferase involved in cell wall biosynthesis
MATEKKILLIAYHFPPSSAVGGLRIAGFARHLPSYGWRPSVLTISQKYIQNQDNARLSGLGELDVLRTAKLLSVRDLYLRLKASCRSVVEGRKVGVAELEQAFELKGSDGGREASGLGRGVLRVLGELVALPDAERSWILPAVGRGLREIKRCGIGTIMTSGPPHSSHLIGLTLKRLSGVRWVADFRDPWMTPALKRVGSMSGFSRKIEKRLERAVIEGCDKVLTTTEILAEELKIFYPSCNSGKFGYVPNGYDPEVLETCRAAGKYERLTITHAGTLYYGRTPEPVFAAVRDLIKKEVMGAPDVQIKLVGLADVVNGRKIKEIVSEYGLDGVVELVGERGYGETLDIIRRSHLALLLAPDQPFQVPAKTYDYIGCGTEILALAGDGATSRLVESTRAGMSFRPDDREGIEGFIHSAYLSRRSPREVGGISAGSLNRRDLTGVLVKCLEEVLPGTKDCKQGY